MKLTCFRMRQELARHADLPNGIPAGTPLAQHLALCNACRREWSALRGLALDLPQVVQEPTPTGDFEPAVWARIDDVARPPRTAPRWIYLALAGAAAAVAGIWLTTHSSLRALRPEMAINRTAPSVTNKAKSHHDERIASTSAPGRAKRPPSRTPRTGSAGASPSRLFNAEAVRATMGTKRAPGLVEPDERFLDGRDASLLARWSSPTDGGVLLPPLPPVQDDFVQMPPPRLAAGGPGGREAIAAALKEYEAQAKVVDTRLFRKVTLQLKGVSLDELCAALQAQTGVELTASRGVQDEKVTVFVKEQRARDVMRAVARLFGYMWGRTGEEKSYRYELVQDLKGQLTEEELRNRDKNAALLALDTEMEKLRPYLALPFEQLEKRWDETGERALFNVVIGGGWGGMQLYHRLTPAERATLASGQELVLKADASDLGRHIPQEWQSSLLRSWSSNVNVQGQLTPIKDVPGIRINQLRLRLDRSELGQTSVRVQMSADWPERGSKSYTWHERTLATGQSPSVARPQNAARNALLKGKAPLDREVQLHPEASCPRLKQGRPGEPGESPHLFSADVWEAVHRETGLPIVADYYTRLYDPRKLGSLGGSLFDVLCQAGDELGVRWTLDGEFLLCRSTGYFWDKLKEVSNRDLQRWRADRQENGGLSLSSFLQMATLNDAQLESATMTRGIVHCWDLREWETLGGRPRAENSLVSHARLLALLAPEQQLRALSPDGIAVRALTGAQQRALLQLWSETQAAFERQGGHAPEYSPELLAAAHYVAEYTPAGWWQWTPPLSTPARPAPRPLAPVVARSEEALKAAVRQRYPEIAGGQIQRVARGHFSGGIRFGPFPAGPVASGQ